MHPIQVALGSETVCEGERDGVAGKGAKHQSRLLIDIIGSLERRGRGTCLPSVRKNLLHCDISQLRRLLQAARD